MTGYISDLNIHIRYTPFQTPLIEARTVRVKLDPISSLQTLHVLLRQFMQSSPVTILFIQRAPDYQYDVESIQNIPDIICNCMYIFSTYVHERVSCKEC